MQTATRPPGYSGFEVTRPPNWHDLVAWDVFLNAAATGLFLVAAVAELARPDLFAAASRWAYPVALVVLLADLACLVFDLGNPTRFHHMLRVFKPSSPMSLGTWCLTVFSGPAAAIVAVDLFIGLGWLDGGSPSVGWVRWGLLALGIPFGFGSAGYKGVLFSTTAQPGWRDARWLGAYHTSGAVAAGCAGLGIVSAVAGDLPAVSAIAPALAAVVVLNLVTLTLLAAELRPTLATLYGPGARRGFGAAVAVFGAALPLLLLVWGGRWAVVVAAAAVLGTGYAVRAVIVHLPHAAHHHPVASPRPHTA